MIGTAAGGVLIAAAAALAIWSYAERPLQDGTPRQWYRTSAPQVLVTLASRFDRTSWKYRGIAYALTLKNVGVLYATMQLAVTAMGLGGCALGTGNAAHFAEATGRDPAAESSVGEFLLGSLPEKHPTEE